MINIILFGPPGSGKGTQAKKLAEKYNLVHISTGDLFRYEMGNNTPLGQKAKEYIAKGKLVPDEVTIGMLENKVKETVDTGGFIFDGYPRNIVQSEALDRILSENGHKLSSLIALEVSEEEIIDRIVHRGKTSGRLDDNNVEIIRKRIEVYKNETTPVFEYYSEKNKSHLVYGMGTIDEIFGRICDVIDAI